MGDADPLPGRGERSDGGVRGGERGDGGVRGERGDGGVRGGERGDGGVRADVVIVGAGSAGCVVAERLSRDPARTVVLLDAGPPGLPGSEVSDLRTLPIGPGSERAVVIREERGRPVVRGRGAGGSSAVNGAYFLRWPRADFDGWPVDWTFTEIEAAYDELDGGCAAEVTGDAEGACTGDAGVGGAGVGDAGGGSPAGDGPGAQWSGTMSATAFTDAELGDVPRAFERALGASGWGPAAVTAWPEPGVVRVRGNRLGGRRRTAADAYLARALTRPNLRYLPETPVDTLDLSGSRVTGVRAGGRTIAARRVVLCAGTFGTAALLGASGLLAASGLLGPSGILGPSGLVGSSGLPGSSGILGQPGLLGPAGLPGLPGLPDTSGAAALPVYEHPELLVTFAARRPLAAPALLQSVVHTTDGLEWRCYSDDFARFIAGVAPSGPAIGVTDMTVPARGALRWTGAGLAVDLGEPSRGSLARMRAGAQQVCALLESPEFDDVRVPGSVRVAAAPGMSQHAWGSLPLGEAVDAAGALAGVTGLHVVDGSILPRSGRSGPHATIMMCAIVIATRLAGEWGDDPGR